MVRDIWMTQDVYSTLVKRFQNHSVLSAAFLLGQRRQARCHLRQGLKGRSLEWGRPKQLASSFREQVLGLFPTLALEYRSLEVLFRTETEVSWDASQSCTPRFLSTCSPTTHSGLSRCWPSVEGRLLQPPPCSFSIILLSYFKDVLFLVLPNSVFLKQWHDHALQGWQASNARHPDLR